VDPVDPVDPVASPVDPVADVVVVVDVDVDVDVVVVVVVVVVDVDVPVSPVENPPSDRFSDGSSGHPATANGSNNHPYLRASLSLPRS
jgi:hypothetical protein